MKKDEKQKNNGVKKTLAHTFSTGENFAAQEYLGCHKVVGTDEYVFRVWAPHAQQVFLVGDFLDWEEGKTMKFSKRYGIWEVTCSANEGDYYKFKVIQADGTVNYKIDPFAFAFELRPGDASKIKTIDSKRKWEDGKWRSKQKRTNHFNKPLNIYEVHAGSWQRDEDGEFLSFAELQHRLIPYVKELGYNYIEFMPLMEHPLDESWGYQLTGYYALSSRYGTPEEFMTFVEACHEMEIGVLMDWVPGHFCDNGWGLVYYDGTPQFEYQDKDRAINYGWGAMNFDLGNPRVQSFLISNALFWLETFHLDGLRVDAVSNMLYRDYDTGPWTPNEDGGVENYEGIHFLRKLNTIVKQYAPGKIMIAEESSAWPKITAPVEYDGLGFDYKWNMGWMNDTLKFYEMDPIHRKFHFGLITFSFVYMYSENYILPLSHDEVVHGKKSLMHKMHGDRYNQFAHLRNLMAYFITHPGKQLSFMGNEWGQFLEWKVNEALEWVDLDDPLNHGMQSYMKELNQFYLSQPALWERDHDGRGMEIIDQDNAEETVLSFIRKGVKKKDFLIVVINFTPVQREDFVIGVPYEGVYEEVFNTEMKEFGGVWTSHNQDMLSEKVPFKDCPHRVKTILPALGVLILKPKAVKITRLQKSKKVQDI